MHLNFFQYFPEQIMQTVAPSKWHLLLSVAPAFRPKSFDQCTDDARNFFAWHKCGIIFTSCVRIASPCELLRLSLSSTLNRTRSPELSWLCQVNGLGSSSNYLSSLPTLSASYSQRCDGTRPLDSAEWMYLIALKSQNHTKPGCHTIWNCFASF